MKYKVITVFLILIFSFSLFFPFAYASFETIRSDQFTLTKEQTFTFQGEILSSDIKVRLLLNKFIDGAPPYIFVKQFVIKPQPTRIETDEKGNMLAVYENFHDRGKLIVQQIALIEYKNIKFKPGSYLVSKNLQKYLSPSDLVQSDNPAIVKKASELTRGITDPYQKAEKIFAFVQNHMTYSYEEKYSNKGALSALQYGKGVCEDHADLMVALLRASGVPARVARGFAVDYDMKNVRNRNDFILPDGSRFLEKTVRENGKNKFLFNSRHAWVEFYLDGEGWIPADPVTSVPKGKSYPYWEHFGALNTKWNYIPEGYDTDSVEEFSFSGTGKIEQTLLTKIKRGFINIPEDFTTIMSNVGSHMRSGITVIINGSEKQFAPSPLIKSGATLVPMRAFFEALGAAVNYDSKTNTVISRRGNTTVRLKIGSKTASVNGLIKTLTVPAQLINGSTFVPLRFISEALGDTVIWDSSTQTIKISSN